eukprot:TRINITY_DN6696_c0_g1_i12.p2 TRINITY_DN6696_c0_g1~~TRINITY_DN6696_c0_g1_i12.p2  ORF type:complete len:395 (-),score=96.09 TRINITY_DN6696_c0_g1_i12:153-1337(-)
MHLQKQYAEYRLLKVKNEELQHEHNKANDANKALIAQLKADLKKKDLLMAEYEEKFENLEEQLQNTEKEKASLKSKLEILLLEAGREASEFRRKNEGLLIQREKEMMRVEQDKTELKKNIEILKTSIDSLNKEKIKLQSKLESSNTTQLTKLFHTQVQTDPEVKCTVDIAKELRDLEFDGKKAKSGAIKKHALSNEWHQTITKLNSANNNVIELKQELATKQEELKSMKAKLRLLQIENDELKKRRELSIEEVKRLQSRLTRITLYKKRLTENTGKPMQRRGKTEEELILSTKVSLESIYKDFVSCAFPDPTKSREDMQALARSLEIKINKLLEQLIEYSNDKLSPHRQTALVARLRPSVAPFNRSIEAPKRRNKKWIDKSYEIVGEKVLKGTQ